MNHTRGWHARVTFWQRDSRAGGRSRRLSGRPHRVRRPGGRPVAQAGDRHHAAGQLPADQRPSAPTRRAATWDLPYRRIRGRRLLGPGQRVARTTTATATRRRAASAGGCARAPNASERLHRLPARSTSTPSNTGFNYAARSATAAPGSSCTSTGAARRPAVSPCRAGSCARDGRARPRPRAGHRDRPLTGAQGAADRESASTSTVAPDPGQPREGDVPAHRHHQGRGPQLLRPGRAGDAAAPRRPRGDPDPLAARHRRASRSSRRTCRAARRAGCARWRCRRPGRAAQTGEEGELEFPIIDSLATLTWLVNLAALELHVHQWTVDAAGPAAQPQPAGDRPRPGRAGRPGGVRPGRAAGRDRLARTGWTACP